MILVIGGTGTTGRLVAAKLAAAGRPVRHRAVDEDALTAYHEAHGLAPDYARFLAGLDTAVAAGSKDRVTTTVADVTGRPARTFRDFCRDRLAGAPRAADA